MISGQLSFPQEVNGPLNSWNHLGYQNGSRSMLAMLNQLPENKVTFLERSFMYTVTI